MSVLIPIMMVGLMAETPILQFPLLPVLSYGGAQVLLFAAGYGLARRFLRCGPGEAVLLATCGIFGNNVFYVLPIASWFIRASRCCRSRRSFCWKAW